MNTFDDPEAGWSHEALSPALHAAFPFTNTDDEPLAMTGEL